MAKDKDYQQLIHTTRWLKLRRDVLTAHPCCQRCEALGHPGVPASEVHHVTPVEYGVTYADKQRLMYDAGNLRALCHNCHVLAHTELGRSGKEATKRRTKEQVDDIIDRFFG